MKRVSAFAVYKDLERKDPSVELENGSIGNGPQERPPKLQKLVGRATAPQNAPGIRGDKNVSRSKQKKSQKLKERKKGLHKKGKLAPKVFCKSEVKSELVAESQAVGMNSEGHVPKDKEMVSNVPFFSLFEPDEYATSEMAASDLFKLLISPFPPTTFFRDVWEKRPMVLQRHNPCYNEGWFSSQELDSILREDHLEFSTNIDLTTYREGERHTHNPVGRATAPVVWEHFKDGCSVRVLNPQTFSKTLWLLNSTLQELFNSGVGTNTYLTPAGSQGFSPHYDDIEAFVLQVEGRKRWKLYKPSSVLYHYIRSDAEHLPQTSSGNFREADIGEPMLEVELEPGDLMYFPRGFIHQASTPPDTHSLHITMSTYQRNTWADLLEKLLPAALQVATSEDVLFRTGLPLQYLHYTGVLHSDSDDNRRDDFFKQISHLFSKLLQYAPIDAAADQMGARFVHDALPPYITPAERACLVGSTGAKWKDGKWTGRTILLSGSTKVKLFRRSIVRLVMEKDTTVLYSTLHNSRCPHEKDLVGVEIEDHESPGVDYLIQCYPEFVSVDSVPIEDGSIEEKICLCDNLYQQGLLMVENT